MALVCKKCGSDTKVSRTSEDGGNIVRVRECKECGNVQVSLEVYLDDMKCGFEYLAKQVQGEKRV